MIYIATIIAVVSVVLLCALFYKLGVYKTLAQQGKPTEVKPDANTELETLKKQWDNLMAYNGSKQDGE